MTKTRDELLREVKDLIDGTRTNALALATQFISDSPRDSIMHLHRRMRRGSDLLIEAQTTPGMGTYATSEIIGNVADFVALAASIQAKMDQIADFIEANFPSFLSVLNAALTALGTPANQQDNLRNQIGAANLGYLLVHRFDNHQFTSPVIVASQLATLRTLLNELAALAEIPPA